MNDKLTTEVIQKLAALEEGQKFIVSRLNALEKKLDARTQANGAQDVALARIDAKIQEVEQRVDTWSKRFWGLVVGVVLVIVENLVSWFARH